MDEKTRRAYIIHHLEGKIPCSLSKTESGYKEAMACALQVGMLLALRLAGRLVLSLYGSSNCTVAVLDVGQVLLAEVVGVQAQSEGCQLLNHLDKAEC